MCMSQTFNMYMVFKIDIIYNTLLYRVFVGCSESISFPRIEFKSDGYSSSYVAFALSDKFPRISKKIQIFIWFWYDYVCEADLFEAYWQHS